jgi:hypothetical protein
MSKKRSAAEVIDVEANRLTSMSDNEREWRRNCGRRFDYLTFRIAKRDNPNDERRHVHIQYQSSRSRNMPVM